MIRAAGKVGTNEAAYLPTEEEIAYQRAALQKSWSKREEARRGGGVVPWTPPVIAMADVCAEPILDFGEQAILP